jgi:hypothetical protein
MEERRGPWYLITGLLLGAAVGLLYAWVISPLRYVETAPSSLMVEFKNDYRSVIAAAYAADGDIGRARARLALLHDPVPAEALAAQAQKILAESGSQSDARQLAVLAAALVASTPGASASLALTQTLTKPVILTRTITPTAVLILFSATASLTPLPTATLTPGMTDISITSTASPSPQPTLARTLTPTRRTGTPLPTLTPTPTVGAPFALKERSRVCDQTAPQPMLQVQINDASGNPVPAVKILISWQDGQESFFTGFMPEVNPGYADYTLKPGVSYTIQLTDGGQPVSDIAAVNCSASSAQPYWGGWYLLLQQP